MAITIDQANAGNDNEKVSDGTLTVTVDAEIVAGKTAILGLVFDNVEGSSGASTRVSATDSRGNTWIRDKERWGPGGGAANSLLAAVLRCEVATTLQVGDTISVVIDTALTAKGAGLASFSHGAGATIEPVAENHAQAAAATSYSVAVDAGSSAETLWIGLNAQEVTIGQVNTIDAAFAALAGGDFGTSGSTGTSNVSAALAYLISTAQNLTYDNASLASADRLTFLIAYREVGGGGQTVAVGQALETDTAQAVAHARTVHIGQALETSTAQEIRAAEGHAFGQALESDTAFAITPARRVAVGQALEADSAGEIRPAETHAVAQALETDSAQEIRPLRSVAIGQALEEDTAQPIAVGGQPTAVGQAQEADTAQEIRPQRAYSVGQALETASAQPITPLRTHVVGQALEEDLAQPILIGGAAVPVGQAQEADTALPMAPGRAHTLGQASESDAAQEIRPGRLIPVGQALEQDSAGQITTGEGIYVAMAQALETDSALALAVLKSNGPEQGDYDPSPGQPGHQGGAAIPRTFRRGSVPPREGGG